MPRRLDTLRRWTLGVAATALLIAFPLAAAQASDDDVREKVDVLAEELASLREQLAIPATDEELTSSYGLGPAASKVYGVSEGVSLGGYGEFYFASPIEDTDETGAVNTADFYRFIAYFGYKFTDQIVMNTEIEFEHATTSSNFQGKSGSVSVEFSYLDFLLHDAFNVRAGNLLVPVGFVNVMHEPAFYRGNFRPEIERRIIPSTWRELGIGIHGNVQEDLRYTAYVVNGLEGADFGSKGVRGGRQKGNRVIWEDVAGVAALHYEPTGPVSVSTSGYYGGADHGQFLDDAMNEIEVNNWIWEAHASVEHRGFHLRGLFAISGIDGADELLASPAWAGDPDVPEGQMGWYLEGAYDVAPWLLGRDTSAVVSPWVRYEDFDLHDQMPDGVDANPARAEQLLTIGVEVKPTPKVVLKGEYVHQAHDADGPRSDEVRFGAGFVY